MIFALYLHFPISRTGLRRRADNIIDIVEKRAPERASRTGILVVNAKIFAEPWYRNPFVAFRESRASGIYYILHYNATATRTWQARPNFTNDLRRASSGWSTGNMFLLSFAQVSSAQINSARFDVCSLLKKITRPRAAWNYTSTSRLSISALNCKLTRTILSINYRRKSITRVRH